MRYKSIFYSAFCVKGVFLNFSFRTIWGFILSQQSSSHIPVFRPDTFSSNHSIFRHDNFIGCFSADKIKKVRKKIFLF